MRKSLLLPLLLLILCPMLAEGQIRVISQAPFTGGTLTSVLRLPDGAVASPAVGWSDGGMYHAAANDIRISVNSADVFRAISGGIAIFPTQVRITNNSGTELYWSGDTADSSMRSDASIDMTIDGDNDAAGAATFRIFSGATATPLYTFHDFGVMQLGADAASPVAQEIKSADNSTSGAGANFLIKIGESAGSNASGGALSLRGGQSTGTGVGGAVIVQSSITGSTGSSLNTVVDVTHTDASGFGLKDAGTKPTCAAGVRGKFWYDAGGAGVADTVEVCTKDASDNYAWRSIY